MAFNDLDFKEMVSLFSPFVNDSKVKGQFLSIPEIAGLHKKVVKAYEGVLSVRPADASGDAELQAIIAEQKPVDYRHDRLTRSLALLLEGHRERALGQDPPDEERAAACDAAFVAILPAGTGIINASYLAEAGNTERIGRLLDGAEGQAAVALLESIPVKPGESARETVGLLLKEGAALGQIETRKAARLAALQNTPAPEQRVIQSARSQWITVASLVVQTLAVSEAPEDVKNAIGHPLVNAAERAGKRAARRGGPAPEETTPTAAATPGAPGSPAATATPAAATTPAPAKPASPGADGDKS